eukprot:3601044-Amphidinium_carterae.1
MGQELAHCVSAFEAFYNVKHSGRKLRWIYSMGGAALQNCHNGTLLGAFQLKFRFTRLSTTEGTQAGMLTSSLLGFSDIGSSLAEDAAC